MYFRVLKYMIHDKQYAIHEGLVYWKLLCCAPKTNKICKKLRQGEPFPSLHSVHLYGTDICTASMAHCTVYSCCTVYICTIFKYDEIPHINEEIKISNSSTTGITSFSFYDKQLQNKKIIDLNIWPLLYCMYAQSWLEMAENGGQKTTIWWWSKSSKMLLFLLKMLKNGERKL